MTTIDTTSEADQSLKAKHRAIWASGNYPKVAAELIPELGPVAVKAAGITAGQRVLDIAAGSGNASIPAALNGARVVASDLTPELFDAGRAAASERGVSVDWVEADAEALPFADNEFDAVISVVGVMFAPHHQQTADEMVRVCKPGGVVAMINWTPEGLIGQLFATMRPYAPAPPPGASPAPLWGSESHVRDLFGGSVTDLVLERRTLTTPPQLTSPQEFREFFKTNYGPAIAVYNSLAPDQQAALDSDFARFLSNSSARISDSPARWEMEYLLVTARKA
ncbi:class I SAM-dependent methyltransferase [Hoyosella altamirensis]|uniref:class I SAM-dependent methyltransferase n=1 Tax=Hoyosella altamirensis TaxID=616997 RepID=UPI0007DB6938|nr:class I SAM-dependent methyltransferase [Hoyosella altamirensis]